MSENKFFGIIISTTLIILGISIYFDTDRLKGGTTEIILENNINPYPTLEINSSLESKKPMIKDFPNKKTLVLDESNTIVIVGPITSESMAVAMQEVQSKRTKLNDDDEIFLFMDTGGGSVIAGLDFIEFTKAIPNKVVTITKFAASMGFQIVQNMNTRYITNSGTLMSHRAKGGVQGQFDGELESQYKWIKEKIDMLDLIASRRMGLDYLEYKELIVNEFWSNGFRSVNNNSADEVVNVRCNESMSGTKNINVQTMLGTFSVVVSKCPMISGILDIKAPSGLLDNTYMEMVKSSFDDKVKFVNDYIKTGTINKFIK